MLTVIGGPAEFERELIRARTGEDRARAMARGVKMGRKPKLTAHQQREAIKRRDLGEPMREIARSYSVSHSTISRLGKATGRAAMLDNPEKTTKLLAALKAVVPFEVELTERLVKQLRVQHDAVADQKHHTVANLSYAGDEGGIVCHMTEALVVSLTHVHVPRSMPLAAAVADYQKHRVKKLKKQGRS
jgi:transcriptional regulator